MMDVSVVVCVRDGERYLAAALESAVAEQPAELIVIDDGSTDASAEIAREFTERLVSQDPLGVAQARVAGVAHASGDAVCFLDADDLFPAGRIAAMTAPLEADGSVDLVMGMMRTFITPERAQELESYELPTEPQPAVTPGGVMIRRQALIDYPLVTGVSPDPVLDWIVASRQRGAGSVKIDHLVLERRIHGDNYSLSAGARTAYVDLARAAIMRRREQ